MSQSVQEHRRRAPSSVGVFLITCSSTRYSALREGHAVPDESGDLAAELVTRFGHRVVGRVLVPNVAEDLRKTVLEASRTESVDLIVVLGGTGLSARDISVETVQSMFEKSIPGFGELFRRLSYEAVGLAAMLSRAVAGTISGKAVFVTPGSSQAVALAFEKIILPEVGHLVHHIRER
ncbi:MAG: molybdenum cofactor biosynthesis protein B [Candidatus Bathyarchaeia archaeon]